MRLPRTLWSYLLREVLLYSLLGLLTITLVLVSRNLLRVLDDVSASGISLADLLTLLGCLVSMLATYSVPIAFLFGVLLAMTRLASDLEITALESCGIGLRPLLVPVALFGLAIACLTGYLLLAVEHQARRELRLRVQTLAAEGKLIEPGQFRRVGERVLYAKRRSAEDGLEGILISDRTDPERPLLIFAERGELTWDVERGELRLLLREGDVHVESAERGGGAPGRHRRIAFRSFDYALDADQALGASLSAYRPREMTLTQLRQAIARAEAGDPLEDLRRRDPTYYRLQLERRLALPVAPVLFALIGVPLGIRRVRGGRSHGALLCALLALGYYALLTLGQSLALEGVLPAAPAAWLPNAAFALTACALLYRARRVAGRL